jgi:ankyrin repeat protein
MEPKNEFITAVTEGDNEKVAALLKTDPRLADEHDASGVSAVLLAVYHGHRDTAQLLASKKKLDIFEAAALGSIEQAVQLLDEDLERANATAPDGFHPLGLACFFGNLALVELLLAHGADPHATADNPTKLAPLHSAVATSDPATAVMLASILLARGVEVDPRQQGGFTPLHAAAQSGNMDLVQLLLAHGADPTARTDDGRTALDFAEEGDHADVARLLGTASLT